MIIYIRYPEYLDGEAYYRRDFEDVETARRWWKKYIAAYKNFRTYETFGGFNVVVADVILRK